MTGEQFRKLAVVFPEAIEARTWAIPISDGYEWSLAGISANWRNRFGERTRDN